MDCDRYREDMLSYIDNELDSESALALTQHLSECEACKTEYEEFRVMIDMIKNLPDIELPEHFHFEFMKRLNKEIKQIKKAKFKILDTDFHFKKYVSVAAGFSLMVVLVSLLGYGFLTKDISQKISESISSSDAKMADYGEVPSLAEGGVYDSSGLTGGIEPKTFSMAEAKSFSFDGSAIKADVLPSISNENNFYKTYYISIRVENFDDAISYINSLAGDNLSQEVYYGEEDYESNGQIIKSVAYDQYDMTKDMIRGLGTVVTENENGENLANIISDTEARLKAKQEETDRLFSLFEKSKTMDVMSMVEGRLSQSYQELDSYKGQLRLLNNQINNPQINISIVSNKNVPLRIVGMDFGSRLTRAFNQNTIGSAKDLIILVVSLAFPISIIIIFIFIVYGMAKSIRRRKAFEK